MEYLANVSPELEIVNGSVRKACFSKPEKAATYLATAENVTNELQEKFALPVCKAGNHAWTETDIVRHH